MRTARNYGKNDTEYHTASKQSQDGSAILNLLGSSHQKPA